MADSNEKYRELVDKLLERTKSGKIDWDMGWGGKVQCNLGLYTVQLDEGETAEGEPLEFVHLLNQGDDVIDTFSDSDLQGGGLAANVYWTRMKELRILAQRKAKGVDQALNSILGELDDE